LRHGEQVVLILDVEGSDWECPTLGLYIVGDPAHRRGGSYWIPLTCVRPVRTALANLHNYDPSQDATDEPGMSTFQSVLEEIVRRETQRLSQGEVWLAHPRLRDVNQTWARWCTLANDIHPDVRRKLEEADAFKTNVDHSTPPGDTPDSRRELSR
jgi:hypothetical protein